jgi:hypothetical protein
MLMPDLRQMLATRIESVALPAYLRDFALWTLETLPTGDRLCRGSNRTYLPVARSTELASGKRLNGRHVHG